MAASMLVCVALHCLHTYCQVDYSMLMLMTLDSAAKGSQVLLDECPRVLAFLGAVTANWCPYRCPRKHQGANVYPRGAC